MHARKQNANAENISWSEIGHIATRAAASAAIGFGSSVIGTAAGKIVSDHIADQGAELVFRGKVGAGCFTKAQARNLVQQGEAMMNTAYGVSSVVGTLFTWPTATVLSMSLS